MDRGLLGVVVLMLVVVTPSPTVSSSLKGIEVDCVGMGVMVHGP